MGFIKLYTEDWNELSINEKAVYVIIAANGTETSHISRVTISKLIGIKDVDVIGKCTDSLEKKGWISREKINIPKGFVYCYHLIDRGNFSMMDKDLLQVSWNANELALLASLFVLRNGNVVDMPNLYKNTGFSKTSYYRHIKELANKGYISLPTKTESLKLLKFVPVMLTKSNQEFVDAVMAHKDDTELYNKISHLIDTNFDGIGDPNKVIKSFITGFGLNKNKRTKCKSTL